MKTIGLLGGMSWESTQSYYALINQGVKSALGGLHSARMLISSVDFAEIAELQRQGDWAQAGELLAASGEHLLHMLHYVVRTHDCTALHDCTIRDPPESGAPGQRQICPSQNHD